MRQGILFFCSASSIIASSIINIDQTKTAEISEAREEGEISEFDIEIATILFNYDNKSTNKRREVMDMVMEQDLSLLICKNHM